MKINLWQNFPTTHYIQFEVVTRSRDKALVYVNAQILQLASYSAVEKLSCSSLFSFVVVFQVTSLVQECEGLRMRLETISKSSEAAELDLKANRSINCSKATAHLYTQIYSHSVGYSDHGTCVSKQASKHTDMHKRMNVLCG